LARIIFLIAVACWPSISTTSAERIKRAPPDNAELDRLAADQAMNDGDLRSGDIISTHRGFLLFRGMKADGSYDFAPVANPFLPGKYAPSNFR
jgi:hypothetical protein